MKKASAPAQKLGFPLQAQMDEHSYNYRVEKIPDMMIVIVPKV
jgi:hypothetical protein